jgi:hypothetical protein
MFTQFNQLSENARIWIYQSENELNTENQIIAGDFITNFINSWTSHGTEVKGSFQVLYNRFIIIASEVDNGGVSGCSIDKSVHAIQELSNHLGVNLIDRKICFWKGDKIVSISTADIKKSVETGVLKPETIFFDHTVASIKDFNTRWQTPVSNSWLKRYFQSQFAQL